MKKVYIALSFLLVMVLFGCSSSMETHEVTTTMATTTEATMATVTMDSSVEYSGSLLSLISIREDSLLYYLKDDYRDFEVFYTVTATTTSEGSGIDVDYSSVSTIVSSLETITEASDIPLSDLVTYSLTRLNETATEYGIILTVDDIVQYYDLQSVIDEVRRSREITLSNYLSYRLGRTVEEEELDALNLLENYYYTLYHHYGTYDIIEKTVTDIENDLISMGITNLTQEDIDMAGEALALIQELLE